MLFILAFDQCIKMMYQNEIVLMFVQNYLNKQDKPMRRMSLYGCILTVSYVSVTEKKKKIKKKIKKIKKIKIKICFLCSIYFFSRHGLCDKVKLLVGDTQGNLYMAVFSGIDTRQATVYKLFSLLSVKSLFLRERICSTRKSKVIRVFIGRM